jgi:FAD/FMN-containing dehydrogenase/Fe-S oxidoreductase
MKEFEEALRASVAGEVLFDEISRTVYSVDASIFEVLPLGVVIPKTKEDLQAIVRLSQQFHVPITVRGAATGIAGGCLGRGLVVDVSKWLNRLLKVDIKNEFVVCEPGLIQDELNRILSPHGYRLGPDTSTGNRATIGGMLGNNAAGARSLRYGSMAQHVHQVELLLSNGEFITFGQLDREGWNRKSEQSDREGVIYSSLKAIQADDGEEIARHFPSIPRRVSGYRLDELLDSTHLNVSRLIAGSEGTLGIATEITLKIVPKPRSTGLLLLFYDEMREALNQTPLLLAHLPLALEMIDSHILSAGRSSPQLRGKLDWLPASSAAVLVVEMEGEISEEVNNKIEQIKQQLTTNPKQPGMLTVLDQSRIQTIWELRKAGLGILLSKRSYSRAIAFIEDLSVPPEHLASFMELFCNLLKSYGKEAGIYGHVGAGCMHIRPYIDLRDPSELSLIKKMMEEVTALVIDHGGTLSGEHGDGWIRSWLNPLLFGERIMGSFVKLKRAFDPDNLMNPGKIIPLSKDWEELRTQPGVEPQKIDTFLDFTPEGGFELAVDMCNGNGLCRKKEKVMCPSFQVTGQEFHSTRARAQALRAITHRRLPLEALTSERMYDVMDLCLSCKGCKTECPSQVDMAKMKSEFLYQYQEKNGYAIRNRIFSGIGTINSWSAPFAKSANRLLESAWGKTALNWLGISTQRHLPKLAEQRFSQWFKHYIQPPSLPSTAVLMNDTFTEFNHPEIGQAAVTLLNGLGYRVILAPWSCCGRPALSKGFLPHAQKQAEKLVEKLQLFAKKALPIIGLEPSCLLTVRDDYRALLPGRDRQLDNVISHCWTLDEFLEQLVAAGRFTPPPQHSPRKVYLHGHCYQKALVGMEKTLTVLNAVPGFQVEQIPSGCCGMAGSFGYEKEHEELSLAIGEIVLFPAIRSLHEEAIIVASGTSCREQISAGTGLRALHLAQALL